MAKNDYISDGLITMRDRLRESTAALREAAEEKRNRPEETPKGPASEPAPAPAESAVSRRQADGLRAQQDLAARITRDRARLAKLLEQTETRRAELRQAQDALGALDRELAQLSPLDPAGRFAADTDRLRLEYFRLCGTLEALAPAHDAERAADRNADGRDLGRRMCAAAWIVSLTVLAAAGIIAGVIAAIFH